MIYIKCAKQLVIQGNHESTTCNCYKTLTYDVIKCVCCNTLNLVSHFFCNRRQLIGCDREPGSLISPTANDSRLVLLHGRALLIITSNTGITSFNYPP